MKPYTVTETAGEWVAGRRVRPGDTLMLTDDQAEYERARRQIVPATPSKAAPAKPKRKRRW